MPVIFSRDDTHGWLGLWLETSKLYVTLREEFFLSKDAC